MELDMNVTHQVLVYDDDDVNLIGDDIGVMTRNADVLLNVGLAVNTRKTKYMEIGRHRGVITNEHIKRVVIPMKK